MSIYHINQEVFSTLVAEIEESRQHSEYSDKSMSIYDYCTYGDYERFAFDSWYEDYIHTNEKLPMLEDIEDAIKEIQMRRDTYINWCEAHAGINP